MIRLFFYHVFITTELCLCEIYAWYLSVHVTNANALPIGNNYQHSSNAVNHRRDGRTDEQINYKNIGKNCKYLGNEFAENCPVGSSLITTSISIGLYTLQTPARDITQSVGEWPFK